MLNYKEYLDFKKYVNGVIVEEYDDVWIKNYIEKYLFDNKLELKDIKRYIDRKKLNKYLLDLHENNLLNELKVLTDMYRYANSHFNYAIRMKNVCEKLSLIPDRY